MSRLIDSKDDVIPGVCFAGPIYQVMVLVDDYGHKRYGTVTAHTAWPGECYVRLTYWTGADAVITLAWDGHDWVRHPEQSQPYTQLDYGIEAAIESDKILHVCQ